jgi:hypothetical protein
MMDEKEQELRRQQMEAEIEANEQEEKQRKRKQITVLIVIAAVFIIGFSAFLALKPKYVPEVYYDSEGRIDYVRQAEKLRGEHKFKTIYDFRYGYAQVSNDGKKFGLIDVKGNLVIPVKYEEVGTFGDPYPELSLVKLNGKYGLVNKQGKEVVKPIYDELDTPNGTLVKATKGDTSVFVDITTGKEVKQ